MLELFSLTDLTGTLSYAIIALSYMMTRIFWLRVAAVIGLFLEIAYFRLSGGDLKVGIGWDAIFILINLVMIFLLVRERASLTLPEKDAPMLRQSFAGLDDAQIARLLKAADWRDAQPGEILTKQDHAVDSLFFLCSGPRQRRGERLVRNLPGKRLVHRRDVFTGWASTTCRSPGCSRPPTGAMPSPAKL